MDKSNMTRPNFLASKSARRTWVTCMAPKAKTKGSRDYITLLQIHYLLAARAASARLTASIAL